ncbi:MAG: GntR family transcriptional regulator [Capsulimonadaceae bacterium]|nr:GntR family transcriptional regulator [Capsulimonadaceae bacterium]
MPPDPTVGAHACAPHNKALRPHRTRRVADLNARYNDRMKTAVSETDDCVTGYSGRKTKSAHVAKVIKQRIRQGVYQAGSQFPSTRTLAEELNFTQPTIQRAVRQLEVEGILESRHGVGIRVLDTAHCRTTPLLFGFVQPYYNRYSLSLHEYLEDALDGKSNLCVVKTSRNDSKRERLQVETLLSSGVNGLLIWPVAGDENSTFFQTVAEQIPVVFVDRVIEGVNAPSVVLDFHALGRKVIRYVVKRGQGRLLSVIDPIDISTFKELKVGLLEEAKRLHATNTFTSGKNACDLTVVDQPLVAMIEASYKNDYTLAHACCESLQPLLEGDRFDAIFCPCGEFFDIVYDHQDSGKVLDDLIRLTVEDREGAPLFKDAKAVVQKPWTMDMTSMFVRALDLLQDITLRRSTQARSVRIPFTSVKR